MSDQCSCHGSPAPTVLARIGPPPAAITAERTVGDVARLHPGALQVMQEMGINHCCGAGLTLAEAAAAAGVALETLLEALDATRDAAG